MNTLHTEFNLNTKALEKAAKIICTLKCGVCPVHEKNFFDCPCECTENTLPWKCWVAHLKYLVSTEQDSRA